jgi:acetate kinase
MDRLGIRIDDQRNRAVGPGDAAVISPDGSEVAVLVVPTNEEYEIARQVMSVVPGAPR